MIKDSPSGSFLPRRFLLVFFFVSSLLSGTAQTESLNDQYLKIYSIVEQADSLKADGKTDQAKAKYQVAHRALAEFQKRNPTWNAKVVAFRLNHVAQELAEPVPAEPAPASATAGTKATAQTKPASQSPSGQQVKLIDAGAEPRTSVRLKAKPGDKQTVDMVTTIAMDMGMGQPMAMPPMQTTLDLTVKNVAPNGDIAYEVIITSAEVLEAPNVAPEVVKATKDSLEGLRGLSTTGTMSARGFNLASEIKLPPGAKGDARAKMEELKVSVAAASTPFPEEPIGVGAKWEVKVPLKTQGMTINQSTTYEVVSLEGDQLHIKSTAKQSAANQKMQTPAAPGMKMDVIKVAGTTEGDTTWDVTKLMPSLATLDSHSEIAMSMAQGAQKQQITMKTDMNIRLETK